MARVTAELAAAHVPVACKSLDIRVSLCTCVPLSSDSMMHGGIYK